MVFLDINVPDEATDRELPQWLKKAHQILARSEKMQVSGHAAPPAYVVLTNHPYHYNLERVGFRRLALAAGFKIPDFGFGAKFSSVREGFRAKNKHEDMFRLMDSLRGHYNIPSTFTGEIPEFVFAEDAAPRLVIGREHALTLPDGRKVKGTLVDAAVAEDTGDVGCIYRLEDGSAHMAQDKLDTLELQAYRQHPDTFFGVLRKQTQRVDGPLEMFEFFFQTYQHTPKPKLLEFMKSHPDLERLVTLEQKELAEIYCERLVHSVMGMAERDKRK